MGHTPLPCWFAVGVSDGPRGTVWRVWAHKSDVYIGARALTGELKISLHESGQCHYAFSSDRYEEIAKRLQLTKPDRFVSTWEPVELSPGLSITFRILVPGRELSDVLYRDPKQSPVRWLRKPALDESVEITFFLTAPGMTVRGWPGRRGMDTELLGKHLLPNGKTLWCVYRLETTAPLLLDRIKDYGGRAAKRRAALLDKHLKTPEEAAIRGHVFGKDHYGVTYLAEVTVLRQKDVQFPRRPADFHG